LVLIAGIKESRSEVKQKKIIDLTDDKLEPFFIQSRPLPFGSKSSNSPNCSPSSLLNSLSFNL